MESCETRKLTLREQIVTLPNLLSLIRLGLIPVIAWLYLKKKSALWTAVVLVFSGITDIVDGYIARHFHLTTDLGKALDPVADKLTQLTMLFCLIFRFPMIGIPFGLLLVKECITGLMSLLVIRKTKKVKGADWHGKVCTVLLYGMMVLHVIWFHIPAAVSNVSVGICTGMMLLSFLLYGVRNTNDLKRKQIS